MASVITSFRKPQSADDLQRILLMMVRDMLPSIFVQQEQDADGNVELSLGNEHEVLLSVRNKRYDLPAAPADDDESWPASMGSED